MSYSVTQLPEETLFVLDGTAMLFHAYFSNERQSSYTNVKLTLAESNRQIERLIKQLERYQLDESTASKREKELVHVAESLVSSLDDSMIEMDGSSSRQLLCGALTCMALQFARLIRDVKPKYVAVTFDSGRKTFRTDMFPEYKQQRSATPPELVPLFELAPKVLTAMGCRCFQQVGYEADDLMATIGSWARKRGLSVVHVSTDKDMLQLIQPGVHVMKPRTQEILGVAEVDQKFGVPPNMLRDYQALAGDSVDNIPGVKGIGPKMACKLLLYFGSIDAMYKAIGLHADQLKLLEEKSPRVNGKFFWEWEESAEENGEERKRCLVRMQEEWPDLENALEQIEAALSNSSTSTGSIITSKPAPSELSAISNAEVVPKKTPKKKRSVTVESTLCRLCMCGYSRVAKFYELVTLMDDVPIPGLCVPVADNFSPSSEDTTRIDEHIMAVDQVLVPAVAKVEDSSQVLLDVVVGEVVRLCSHDEGQNENVKEDQGLELSRKSLMLNTSHFLYVGESSVERLVKERLAKQQLLKRPRGSEISAYLADISESLLEPLRILREQYHKLDN